MHTSKPKVHTKRQPRLAIWSLTIRSFSLSSFNFFTFLILATWETLVEYRLITYLPKALSVFSPYSFISRCFYAAYVLLIVLLLALSTFYVPIVFCHLVNAICFCLLQKRHSCFLCCSIPSFGLSTVSAMNSSSFNFFSDLPSSLWHSRIATIWQTIWHMNVMSIGITVRDGSTRANLPSLVPLREPPGGFCYIDCCCCFTSLEVFHFHATFYATDTPSWLFRPMKVSTSSEFYTCYFWLLTFARLVCQALPVSAKVFKILWTRSSTMPALIELPLPASEWSWTTNVLVTRQLFYNYTH